MLDENCQLIQSIIEHHNQGKINEAAPFQQQLHKNLVYLATVADSQGPGSIQARVAQFFKLSFQCSSYFQCGKSSLSSEFK